MFGLGKKRTKLGRWLDRRGIKQEWVVDKGGVSRTTVSNACGDEHYIPSGTSIKKIIKARPQFPILPDLSLDATRCRNALPQVPLHYPDVRYRGGISGGEIQLIGVRIQIPVPAVCGYTEVHPRFAKIPFEASPEVMLQGDVLAVAIRAHRSFKSVIHQ